MDVWLLDADGFFAGELHTTDDLETITAKAAENGQNVIDQAARNAVRPPDRPRMPEQEAKATKATRLTALRAKGWVQLTAAERDEATGLRFDLGF